MKYFYISIIIQINTTDTLSKIFVYNKEHIKKSFEIYLRFPTYSIEIIYTKEFFKPIKN